MANKPILEMRNVQCRRGSAKSKLIIEDFSMSIYEKASTVIIGESASGREIIADVILGKKNIDSGSLSFNSNLLDKKQNRNLQYIPKNIDDAFDPMLSVLEGVSEGLIISGADKTRALKRARHLLNNFGMNTKDFFKRYSELSFYKKILAVLARALLLRPKLIIVSDIFERLFFTEKDNLIKIMALIQNKYWLSYIFITNDMYAARFLCDKAILMCAGRVMESGLIDKIFISPGHPYTEAMLWADCLKLEPRPPMCKGEVEGYDQYKNGCPFSNRCRFAVPQCLNHLPKLKEIEKGHFVRCIRAEELKLKPIID